MTNSLSNPARHGLAALVSLALCAGQAQAGRNDPGSLLVFPEYDTRPGSISLLTVTNVNGDAPVGVRFAFVEADTCDVHERRALLSPGDTLTLYPTAQLPAPSRGFCFAYAVDVASGEPIDFDHLVGSEVLLEATSGSECRLNAFAFEGLPGAGLATDLDRDGVRDLDGAEYAPAPARLVIPQFFGQSDGPPGAWSELILIPLTERSFQTTVDLLIYNDNEDLFTAEFSLACWARVPLASISGLFGNRFLSNNTNHAAGEILGLPGVETGWFQVWGNIASNPHADLVAPAILAALVEVGSMSSASLPFTIGENTNGELWTHGIIWNLESR